MIRQDLARRCALAVLAGALVTLQYSCSTRPFEVPSFIEDLAKATPFSRSWHAFDLHPFPFWSERRPLAAQLGFHARYFAAHLEGCHEAGEAEAFRGRYTLRAGHDKEEVHCAARLSDFQIARRCREQRTAQPYAGAQGLLVDGGASLAVPPQREGVRARGASALRCPDAEARAAFAALRSSAGGAAAAEAAVASAHDKYARRAAGLGCDDPEAEWRLDLRHYHKCILVTALERLRLPPRSVVLDWGSGCGHKLSWAAHLYGLDGLGVDIVGDNVRWAQEHSLGSYCEVDGRFISWLPEAYFDGVISYAALMHLDPADQCEVVLELVGKVRLGGRLWFGWNAPEIWSNNSELEARWMLPAREAWGRCFAKATKTDHRWASGEIAIIWETLEEQFLFPDDKDAIAIYLYLPPAYSLFITRVASGRQPDDYP